MEWSTGKGSSGRAVAESEWGQAMDVWMGYVHDYEEMEKEKKGKGIADNIQKKAAVVALREKMSQTFRERRAAAARKQAQEEESTEGERQSRSSSIATKDRRFTDNVTEGPRDRAFASQRRTADRIISSFKEGDQSTADHINNNMVRHEALEREKMSIMREFLKAHRVGQGGDLEVRVATLEKQNEELRELICSQSQDLREAMSERAQQTDTKLDTLLAILQQRQ